MREALEVVALVLFGLAGTVHLALTTTPADRIYAKAHHAVFIVSLFGLLGVLLVMPSSSWRRLMHAWQSIRSGTASESNERPVLLLAGLLVLLVVVSVTVIDWNVVGRLTGISAVVAVNLAWVARGLWVKYSDRRR